jgi:hypothetical protein
MGLDPSLLLIRLAYLLIMLQIAHLISFDTIELDPAFLEIALCHPALLIFDFLALKIIYINHYNILYIFFIGQESLFFYLKKVIMNISYLRTVQVIFQ